MTNEQLCTMIQDHSGSKRDKYLAQLLEQNTREFKSWVYDEFAHTLQKEATIHPDEMMAEALAGFRRAAEKYRPEDNDGMDFVSFSEYWVRARVGSYVRKAERGTLPDRMFSSVQQYDRIMCQIKHGEKSALVDPEKMRECARAILVLAFDKNEVAIGY